MLLDKAVPIRTRRGTEVVVTAEQAARVLLQWPGKADTAKQRAARAAVLKALQSAHGHRDKVKAREALEEAAKESGVRDG